MAKSSINFAKATTHSQDHNFRKDKPSYLLPLEHQLENVFWKNEKKETELFSESAALQKTGRKPKLENSRWEAIINFNKNHSLGDLQIVAKHIENKFNITCSSIAMHKDEGHVNERGIVEYNLHAHVNFITHKNGKQNWRKEFVKPKDLRELQTEVAELLGMERGTDKRISKTERLEHTQFKQQVKELAKQKDLKSEIAELRVELQAHKATRADYAELEELNKELKERIKDKDLTIDELKNELEAKISVKATESTPTELKSDLTSIYRAVPSIYEIEEAQRRGAGFAIHRFIEDKGIKGIRSEKISWLYKKEIPTVTFDEEEIKELKENLQNIDKVQIGLAKKVLGAYKQEVFRNREKFERDEPKLEKTKTIAKKKSSGLSM